MRSCKEWPEGSNLAAHLFLQIAQGGEDPEGPLIVPVWT